MHSENQSSGSQPIILNLDADGLITAANPAALAHWETQASALLGKPIVELVYASPAILASLRNGWNWGQLLARAQAQPIPAFTHCNTPSPKSIYFQLQPASGDSASYFATLAPIASALTTDKAASLLENLSHHDEIGSFDLDFVLNTAAYSPGWKRMIGYTETEIPDTYATWLKLIHPHDSAAAPDHHKRRPGQTLRNFSVEMRLRHRDGHYHWVHCLGTQHYSPLGKLEQISGLQIDIHERKSYEEAALRSEDRLHQLTADTQLAAFDLSFDQSEHWFSSAWKQLLPSTVRRRNPTLNQILPLFSAELRDTSLTLADFLGKPSPGAAHCQFPLTLTDHQGLPRSAEISCRRQYDDSNRLVRATGYCILKSTSNSETLSPSSSADPAPAPAAFAPELFAPILESLHESILLTDPAGKITHLNRRAEHLLGRPTATLIGQPLAETFRLIHPETRQPATEILTASLHPTQAPILHNEHLLQSNPALPPQPIVWSTHPLRAETDTAPLGYALLFRDPRAMPLTPEELLEANRLENLGNLAGGISHDFNNLLTTILGGISQARDNRDNSFLADSERACLAAKDLTRQLLATAKGTPDNSRQVLSLSDLLHDAARLTRAGSHADIHLDVPAKLAPVYVNRSKLQQVLQNLIVNAIHALPPRGGHIWLGATEKILVADESPPLAAGRYLEISIRDNGCGIPAPHLEKIFTPFFTTKKNGTGLGLATVQKIIREYAGDIRVTSHAGQGTTFTIVLPANKTNQAAALPTRRRATLLHGTGRILLMEDNPDICRITQGMLQSIDYRCDIAPDGEKAIELYESYRKIGKPYDIVLLDLTVAGGMGGEETFHKLQAIDPAVRAIAASGYDHSEIADRLLAQGFCGYLTKPYRVTDLVNAIKDALGKPLPSASPFSPDAAATSL